MNKIILVILMSFIFSACASTKTKEDKKLTKPEGEVKVFECYGEEPQPKPEIQQNKNLEEKIEPAIEITVPEDSSSSLDLNFGPLKTVSCNNQTYQIVDYTLMGDETMIVPLSGYPLQFKSSECNIK